MSDGPLSARIIEAFDAMPAQLRKAARYVLDRPHDVALLSMREQARRAEVPPATMTRFARHLGFTGYEDVREIHAQALRGGAPGFAGKAGAQLARQKLEGDRGMAAAMLASLRRQIEHLGSEDSLDALTAAADRLAGARRIYSLGLRASHPVAWQLHYMLSLVGEPAICLDTNAGTGADALADAGEEDVLLAVSVEPYTRLTIEIADYAAQRGIGVLAITDSAVAPLARIARQVILVPTDSPSFFHAMAPAFILAEILGALVAGHGGEAALAALARKDEHLRALGTHFSKVGSRQP
ncbi:RpiR family transcriptional regulator [Labrys miyagiensis]|uniref:RpiR family transcriptional regulator n=1 Tax=Labrys miyagiensis TaxID=346912 RepID=A0ABQ6CDF3_9HYPH|nr:MurR/RpiR family transcriptional regulator [Labrys miyagiensis]GLS18234.1 RpiR family transcriptional regulator [Labrys miyagiensis]